MSSDMEQFINLILMTEYMNNLLLGGKNKLRENKDIIIALEDWSKYKDVQELINLNNKHINNAIREVLSNEKFVKEIKENTNIDIDKINLN